MLWDEQHLVVQRTNAAMATLGVVVQAATMTTGMGASKEAAAHFTKLLNMLGGE